MTVPLDTVDGNAVRAAAETTGLRTSDVTVEYTGRPLVAGGMAAATCLGVYLPHGTDPHWFMVELTAELVRDVLATATHDSLDGDMALALDTAVRMARAARTDQMGRGLVLYFPGWNLHGEDKDIDFLLPPTE